MNIIRPLYVDQLVQKIITCGFNVNDFIPDRKISHKLTVSYKNTPLFFKIIRDENDMDLFTFNFSQYNPKNTVVHFTYKGPIKFETVLDEFKNWLNVHIAKAILDQNYPDPWKTYANISSDFSSASENVNSEIAPVQIDFIKKVFEDYFEPKLRVILQPIIDSNTLQIEQLRYLTDPILQIHIKIDELPKTNLPNAIAMFLVETCIAAGLTSPVMWEVIKLLYETFGIIAQYQNQLLPPPFVI